MFAARADYGESTAAGGSDPPGTTEKKRFHEANAESSSPWPALGKEMQVNPMIHEAATAAKREEVLSGVERRRQISEALTRRDPSNARQVRPRVWLLHQLTWPRWPRAAVDEA